jgi:hypothetical protein
LAAALTALGHEITYDWSVHGSVQKDGPERIREVAEAECNGVLQADLFVCLLPGGRGTHTELGIALGNKRHKHGVRMAGQVGGEIRIVLVGDDGGADERTCCFYHHPDVDCRFDTTKEFLAFVRGLGARWR